MSHATMITLKQVKTEVKSDSRPISISGEKSKLLRQRSLGNYSNLTGEKSKVTKLEGNVQINQVAVTGDSPEWKSKL